MGSVTRLSMDGVDVRFPNIGMLRARLRELVANDRRTHTAAAYGDY